MCVEDCGKDHGAMTEYVLAMQKALGLISNVLRSNDQAVGETKDFDLRHLDLLSQNV